MTVICTYIYVHANVNVWSKPKHGLGFTNEQLVSLVEGRVVKPIDCIDHDPVYYPSGIRIVQWPPNVYGHDPVHTHTPLTHVCVCVNACICVAEKVFAGHTFLQKMLQVSSISFLKLLVNSSLNLLQYIFILLHPHHYNPPFEKCQFICLIVY